MPQRLGDSELGRINLITERIIGCAIEVHRILRGGLLESVYRAALAIEFEETGVTYARELRVPAMYKGRLLGEYRLDFLVEDEVIVEVKSVERLNPVFDAQLMHYLRLKKKRIGLLINFNTDLVKNGIVRKIV